MKADDPKPIRRCAIYTRVSTENGLEQEFNSLDNQREASEAYVKSQAHEGWRLIRTRYDDGGFSGGSLDRPALQTLLDDVRAQRVDAIVVYKVDRLTRSLSDFAKFVELFDEHGVSFVSVTQSFNTTTSMGRLTLNVLLSFAQFEREVTGERIRDKVAASKKNGIWMGGAVPLGYRVENRALRVVEEHAAFVRDLFRRYLEIGGVVRLKAALDAENVRSPIRISGNGKRTGGGPMSRGHLYWILSNPIYIGRLRHKGQIHEGQHEAIVDPETWKRVQERLAAQTQARRAPQPDAESFLVGKLFGDRGRRMGASFAAKGARRWRYYVSRGPTKTNGHDAATVMRVCAPAIEKLASAAIASVLAKRGLAATWPGCRANASAGCNPGEKQRGAWTDQTATPNRQPDPIDVRAAIDRIQLGADCVRIVLSDAAANNGDDRTLTVPWKLSSPYRRREIIQGDSDRLEAQRPMRAKARETFLDAVRDAHRRIDELLRHPTSSLLAIAQREATSERSIRQSLSLAFLDPSLVKAAIEGRLPRGFGVKRLIDLPMLWSEQWATLGLRAPALDH